MSVAVVAIAGGPLACDLFKPPEMPQAPGAEPPKEPEIPKGPDAPEAPVEKEPGGNCCVKRNSWLSERVCQPAGARCCSDKMDSEECTERGGVWFHSAEGCAGAGC